MIDSQIKDVTTEDVYNRNEVEVCKKEDLEKVDDLLEQIEKFITEHAEAGKKDDAEKDKLYGELKNIWKELSNHINNIGFIFNINDEEYSLLKNYLISKCNYDHQTVFMGIQLKGDFLKRAEAYRAKNEQILVTCSETILIHHLFTSGGFTVKGLDIRAYHFRNIMTAIGEINKIYTQLDVASKAAGKDVDNWVLGLEKEEKEEKKS